MPIIKSIIIRPQKKLEPMHVHVAEITLQGIEGDHYTKPEGNRQVTLIAQDDMAEVAAVVGFQGDVHLACRRNIMVDTFPEEDLAGKIVGLGDAVILEITGYCRPCIRMEENLGDGAIDAFEKKAGWTAKVLKDGRISVGDKFFVK